PAPPPGSGRGPGPGSGAGPGSGPGSPPGGVPPGSGPGGFGPGGFGPGGSRQQPGAPPVCPRHPDRVSYVSCQRCGRPACPECQRPAPVGVHCVDCAAQAERSARPERTRLGGRRRSRPYVTIAMIVACVALYVLGMIDGGASRDALFFSPLAGAVGPYCMLTTDFLYANLLHLAVFMLSLWIIGAFL